MQVQGGGQRAGGLLCSAWTHTASNKAHPPLGSCNVVSVFVQVYAMLLSFGSLSHPREERNTHATDAK